MGPRVKVLGNASGMALLITLAAISFLVAVTVQLATSVNWQMQVSANQREAVRLNGQLHSGLSLMRAALYSDSKGDKVDTLEDEWNKWNTPDFDNVQSLIGAEQLKIEIKDLSGKIQINSFVLSAAELKKKKLSSQQYEQIQRGLWSRFLLSNNFVDEQDKADELFDALADWLDEDDNERPNGFEKGHYQSLSEPRKCRNGPLQYLEELLLVQGFTKDILYGDGERDGIIDYLTIDGQDGKININTAHRKVLYALSPAIDDDIADQLEDFREDPNNKALLGRPDWYRQVGNFPGYANIDPNLITTVSSYFLCTVIVGGNGLQLTGTGKIERDNSTHAQNLLSWKVE